MYVTQSLPSYASRKSDLPMHVSSALQRPRASTAGTSLGLRSDIAPASLSTAASILFGVPESRGALPASSSSLPASSSSMIEPSSNRLPSKSPSSISHADDARANNKTTRILGMGG